ncbi:MAG: D-aminoacyl-tRNA deacylase [Eubacteriales bacterium]|nr:D-aminoacyl-tRNA deacylase [Eubacteriales bacterium]
MRFIIQRVLRSSVLVDGRTVGNIDRGLTVFVGISKSDTKDTADRMLKKLLHLRIFEDENGKTNLSLSQVQGGILLISQFTLYADLRHGNRPSFTDAGSPDSAEPLYQYLVESCKKSFPDTQQGIFGADMEVRIINDGPFTIYLDSEMLSRPKA